MFTYACDCFHGNMAALNTCNRDQIPYRAYGIYRLVIHRKGLPTPGLKTKGQGEETAEIIPLGGERWLPKASTLTLERVETEFQPVFSAYPTPHSQLARFFCMNTPQLYQQTKPSTSFSS